MIVDPDFPDHWKTRLLVELLGGDELAPLYLIRLWAHCQNRRASTFENLPPLALKALCRYPGLPAALESALADAGFVRRENQTLTVVGWEDYNATLVANWENGRRGGRPPKPKSPPPPEAPEKPMDNPPETHGLSMGNPRLTHGEPIREDRIGEDKIRFTNREIERETACAGIRRPSLDESKSAAANLGIPPDKADEWWHAREASEWLKGVAGGGTTPVGSNWQADLKTYALRAGPPSSIGRSSVSDGKKGPARKPLTKLPWE
ncbi:MAG: hypothetical protein EOP88_23390 [Verrucomicrobiaceae bacterium]|nr:MAG: hypothetical protein EOP88_23390 [Verrucomicrobiaceae bacterium]